MFRILVGAAVGVGAYGLMTLLEHKASTAHNNVCVICNKTLDDEAAILHCQHKHKVHNKCFMALKKEGLQCCPKCNGLKN